VPGRHEVIDQEHGRAFGKRLGNLEADSILEPIVHRKLGLARARRIAEQEHPTDREAGLLRDPVRDPPG
jgi:hypothetical protein